MKYIDVWDDKSFYHILAGEDPLRSLCGNESSISKKARVVILVNPPDGEKPANLSQGYKNYLCDTCKKCNEYCITLVRLRGGQIRRYGPTVYQWEVHSSIDYTREELFAAVQNILGKRPVRGDPGWHPLSEHVQVFERVGKHWIYQTGHEYTG